jgi:dUTP pyrophosphatase
MSHHPHPHALGMARIQARILDARIAAMLPEYATQGSAGMDLRACVDEPVILAPGEARLIPTGLAIHLGDAGYCALIIPRSGSGHKRGLVLGNLAGLIDSDYQGPLMVSAWNRSDKELRIEPFERIAQMMIVPVATPVIEIVEEFGQTARGSGGFGSTGSA